LTSPQRTLPSEFRRVRKVGLRAIFGPRLRLDKHYPTIRLGSIYGGWTFVPVTSLHNAVVVSAGVGEDATFDVELASRFGCRVTLVDPTPRAIEHVRALKSRIGQPSLGPYLPNGCQYVEAYDLSAIAANQLQLDSRALTAATGTVRFFAPKNPTDVSYSILNFQNDYSADTQWIDVPAVSVVDLLEGLGIDQLELLKLDIEGAEIEVIPAMLARGFRPRQLLVEYDELNWPSRRSRSNFDLVHRAVMEANYVVTWFDRRSCVSYAHGPSFPHRRPAPGHEQVP
jgi:FkbM family methyltransferase